MSISIRINDDFYNQAKIQAKAELRTVPNQIEYWARIGRAAMHNPDLPVDMVEKLLIAKNEENEPFEFTDQ
ncbi:hypothetical protein BPUTSESOX_1999 [uncultured Gammaproteobacteria bacterium]|jgi:hypothetical protein|uniref:TA system antitoxin ParD family protein n=1 Tax=thiotrophic endosymbiont of Bathymodiolus puteoserpentis (Logatchev) TaxID=343240 RepID=UPI0010B6339D|nr:hypothetical protein [thiotrophic endosymbiont of Bathymodiolus puteoserpentis (Logatchev)]CAC9495316.1 hypothetical protein [uncultured Gammaproteobacteria bacterium]CAC9568224.1 hypothetical protein [uncultured Gammaproteobacteria bacterium]CAC9640758.1 hypothetical protein [uncultured Gammaproteobacteria bacterium]CAC9990941.1 hypothetical protein [uncultured Gammaproteobacteria bacterium]SSC11294.1 hypothetical protein BPUTEOSOX_1632 [thiotrophic endosymbiont of Bathymodiolus puteoserpe